MIWKIVYNRSPYKNTIYIYIYCLHVYTLMIVLIVSIKTSLQDFTLNSVVRKLWFTVFVATYVSIESKVSHVTLFYIPKNLPQILRNKSFKKIMAIVIKKQKSYSKSKNVQKMPKSFSLKIHKGAGIFTKTQNLSK